MIFTCNVGLENHRHIFFCTFIWYNELNINVPDVQSLSITLNEELENCLT